MVTKMLIFLPFLFLITIRADDQKCPEQPKIVRIDGEPYLLVSIKTKSQQQNPPLIMKMDTNEIYYNTVKQSYRVNIQTKKERKLGYRTRMKYKQEHFYPGGGEVVIKDEKLQYILADKNSIELNSGTYKPNTLIADSEGIKVLVLASSKIKDVGRVFVFNRNMKAIGGIIRLEEVQGLGYNVTAITLDKENNKFIISVMEGKDDWTFKTLEKLDKQRQTKPVVKGINKKALLSAIEVSRNKIIELYDEAVKKNGTEANDEEALTCEKMLDESEAKLSKIKESMVILDRVLNDFNMTNATPGMKQIMYKSRKIINKITKLESLALNYDDNNFS